MKTLKLIALAVFALLFSQCKTMAPTAPTGPAPSLLEVQQILDTTASKFLQYADSTNGDPWRAIMLTANWVRSQPTVQSVSTIDSTYLDIVLKSGLQADFFFNMVNDSGYSIFRGGGGKSQTPAHISFSSLSKNTITNKKVLIYAPAWTEFKLQSTVPKTVNTLLNSGLGLDVTLLKDEECTPAIANTFKDYGLVIIDTHGKPDAYMSGTIIDIAKDNNTDEQYKAAVIQQAGQDVYDRLMSKDYRVSAWTEIPSIIPNWQKRKDLKRAEEVYVTTQYIKSLPSMPNTVIFGNMCYSGYAVSDPSTNITYPMRTAFMDKNPISYYGYALYNDRSTAVTDLFSKDMEDSLTKRLVNDLDSTGIANLRPADGAVFYDNFLDDAFLLPPNSITLLFKHFGADDYSYEKCGDTITDIRDGQKYASVCIGKQIWMAQNLNFNASGSVTYNNDPANGKIFGRLYDFPTIMQGADTSNKVPSGVQGICPKGWHVPSVNEFQTLLTFLGGGPAAGGAMKSTSALWNSPNSGATNSSGFSGLPGGFVFDLSPTGASQGIGDFAYFATTTLINSQYAWLADFLHSTEVLSAFRPESPTKAGVSCRCVKDP